MRFKNIMNLKLSIIRRLLKQGKTIQNLRNSDLRGSDLRYSNLSYSNLNGSNLRDSDLSGSKGLKFIQISGIGSANRQTTYLFNYDIVFCGCFKGTLVEFEEEVRKTHVKNIQYLNEYLGLLKYIKKLKKIKQ